MFAAVETPPPPLSEKGPERLCEPKAGKAFIVNVPGVWKIDKGPPPVVVTTPSNVN